MDCSICQIRSSIGYCTECGGLLCEECAETCSECGKPSCPEHMYGRHDAHCIECADEKEIRRTKHKNTTIQETTPEQSQEGKAAERFQPFPAWEMSLWNAGLGALAVLMLFSFPNVRRFPLPSGRHFPTSYLVIFLPAMAIIWSLVALRKKTESNAPDLSAYKKRRIRRWSYIAFTVGLACLILAALAYWTDSHQQASF